MGTARAILVGLVALAAFTSSVARAQPTGGPGRPCTRDVECGACGWICSAARGLLCIPAFEGDVGSCAVDADCACPGQTCSGGQCIPLAQTQCRCDSDCPSGRHCNQLIFACQTGACDTDYGTQYANGCQDPYFPPECIDDIECGVSVRGATCVPMGAGPYPGCAGCTHNAWCRPSDAGCLDDPEPDAGDGGSPAGSNDGGDGDGGGGGASYLSSTGCTCGSGATPMSLGALLILLAMYATLRRRIPAKG